MSIQVKIIADSVSQETDQRLTTIQIKCHRFIIPELNTHRVFSRNYSSSRAIPVARLIEQVQNDPALPVFWGSNQPGMRADTELPMAQKNMCKEEWLTAAKNAADSAKILLHHGLHKQTANRLLEPFIWIHGIITSSEWENFFKQRCHPDAQPEIKALAEIIQDTIYHSVPKELSNGQWHLPYIRDDELKIKSDDIYLLQKISAARCARVSYMKHDGTNPSIDDDLNLYDKLVGGDVCHYSPLEHQATPDNIDYRYEHKPFMNKYLHGNLNGWQQFRKIHEFTSGLKQLHLL